MKPDQELKNLFNQEFQDILPNTIWQNDNGVYEVFSKYRIEPVKNGYRVWCFDSAIGTFKTTRTALSWCIADKYNAFNLARDLLSVDNKLTSLTNDINSRASIGDRSSNPLFRENIGTKLETKIIQKKQLENELSKYVKWAKYCQQRGFENETARTGRTKSNKTSR